MNCRPILLLCAMALAGCASFDRQELAQVRAKGVADPVYHKLDTGGALAPRDVIELTHRHVPDSWIIRQIEDHGVDSLITRADLSQLRRAGVHPEVIDVMIRESDSFVGRYLYGPDYYSEYYGYYPGWSYPGPYWYGGGYGVGFGGGYGGGHHHGR